MVNFNRPLSLGDIFSETFSLIRFTFTRSIIIVLVFMIPAALLLTSGFNSLLNSIPLSISRPEEISPAVPDLISGLIFHFFTIGVYLLLYLAVWVGLIYIGGEELKGRGASLGNAFAKIFSLTYLKVLGLYILLAVVVYGIMLIPIGVIIAGGVMYNPAVSVAGTLFLLLLIPLMIYLVFKWYFAGVNVIITGENILPSFSRSSRLVKDNWWRTFGLLLLLSIVFNVIASFISAPLTILLVWDFISTAIKNPDAFKNPTGPQIIEILKSFIGNFGYLIAFSSALQLLTAPFYTLLMYYDLRIRKNDFHTGELGPDRPLPHGEAQFN